MKKFKFILMLFLLIIFPGCEEKKETINFQDYEISFIDDDGNRINLDKPAERIISLYSAHTENIYFLGAEEKLCGGYKTCVFPPEAAFLPMFDYNGDPEAIIAAKPDLVLIRPFIRRKAPEFISILERTGIQVVSLYPETFDKFDDYIKKLAMLTGTSENAEKLLKEFHDNINEIKENTKLKENKCKVFFESTENNIRTVTDNSMAGIAINIAGGINIASDIKPIEDGSSIAPFGHEKILENADNIDVYISQRGSMNSGGNITSICERAGFNTIKAIKNKRVYVINEKIISSPTFRFLDGVKELSRFFYPDIIDNYSEYNNENQATNRSLANIIVMYRHIPIYIPTSSSYYKTNQNGHYFGLFQDIKWNDEDFYFIETAVEKGYINWTKEEDKEFFYPDKKVTRDELAQTIFIMGNFSNKDIPVNIKDIDKSNHQRIVKILVQNGVFKLNSDSMFEPERIVTNREIIEALKFLDK